MRGALSRNTGWLTRITASEGSRFARRESVQIVYAIGNMPIPLPLIQGKVVAGILPITSAR